MPDTISHFRLSLTSVSTFLDSHLSFILNWFILFILSLRSTVYNSMCHLSISHLAINLSSLFQILLFSFYFLLFSFIFFISRHRLALFSFSRQFLIPDFSIFQDNKLVFMRHQFNTQLIQQIFK